MVRENIAIFSHTIFPIFISILLSLLPSVRAGTIDPSLLAAYGGEDTLALDVIIEFPSVLDSVLDDPTLTVGEDGRANPSDLIRLLQQATSFAQQPVIAAWRVSHSFVPIGLWISNDVFIDGMDLIGAREVAAVDGIFNIRQPEVYNLSQATTATTEACMNQDLPWGVQTIQAPAVWTASNRGEGVVIAGIDTGVNIGHEALSGNFGGEWFDPVNNEPGPVDRHGHGTHIMGIAVGTTRDIGVAPGASWIACRGFDNNGFGSEHMLKLCAQWVMQRSVLPRVVNNPWSGRPGWTNFNDVIKAWRVVGIIPVFGIGNGGPGCFSAVSPGDQPLVISVGSTSCNDTVNWSSSRGLTAGSRRVKPELTAPGDRILSAGVNAADEYVVLSGTSMAAAHVVGAIALMLSRDPGLTYNQVLGNLASSALKPPVAEDVCELPPSSVSNYPNNAFGHGRIDVRMAMGI